MPKEIPHETKRRLGLDDERSWIVLTEANRFAWPGPDLRLTQPGDLASVAYGLLPPAHFKQLTAKMVDAPRRDGCVSLIEQHKA